MPAVAQTRPRFDKIPFGDNQLVLVEERIVGRIINVDGYGYQYRPKGHYDEIDGDFVGEIFPTLDACKRSLL